MTLSLEQLSARMRQGEDIPLSDTARIALALSIPSILEQLVVTAMEYIDAAMVEPHRRRGHRRHRHRQLEHLAAPRHPCGTVHCVFDPNRPVPRG